MVRKGDIYYADFEVGVGSEQSGYRPIVIIQNDIGNKYSPTTIVAMITKKHKKPWPTHVMVNEENAGGHRYVLHRRSQGYLRFR